MSGSSDRGPARVLLHSQRNPFASYHFRAGLYEFENIISEIDSVDWLTPEPGPRFEFRTWVALHLAAKCGTSINPGIRPVTVETDYDLFFAVAQFPKDLLHIKYVKGWRRRCRTAVCWLNEVWIRDIANTRYFLDILREFDYVVLQQTASVAPVQDVVKTPCIYAPSGIDAIRFSPYPNPPERLIDVYSIGRRAPRTHRALLEMAKEGTFFYVYDSINGEEVVDPDEHRLLYANMAKRSRYFIVNPGKVNKPADTGGQVEFGNRFFEGAAAGTVMVGEAPRNDEFHKVFNWPDAVVEIPFDSDRIRSVIESLDADVERQQRIRTTNVVKSLLHHDWVYRWQQVLDLARLSPQPAFHARKARLRSLAALAERRSGSELTEADLHQ